MNNKNIGIAVNPDNKSNIGVKIVMKKITEMNIQEIEKMISDFEKDTGRKLAHINITNFQLNKIIKNTEHPDIYHYPTSGRIRVNNTNFNIGNYEEDEDSLNAIFSN